MGFTMTFDAFKKGLSTGEMPADLSPALQALWLDASGDWHAAHERLQAADDQTTSWVHAYLHRKEGDLANAGYWYRKAGRSLSDLSLEQEWDEITAALLPDSPTR